MQNLEDNIDPRQQNKGEIVVPLKNDICGSDENQLISLVKR
jgi:hypothetical protein